MRRVIVELKPSANMQKSMAAESSFEVDNDIQLPGINIDKAYGAVQIDAGALHNKEAVLEMGVSSAMTSVKGETVIVRGTLNATTDDETKAAKKALLKQAEVIHVWDDGLIEAFSGCNCQSGDATYSSPASAVATEDLPSFTEILGDIAPLEEGVSYHASSMAGGAFSGSPCEPTDCAPTVAKGTIADVARYLNCHRLWDKGIRGQGVAVGIVDTGVDSTRVPNVTDGWTPVVSLPWGTDSGSHGSMCATDVKGMAPDAEIYDVGLLKAQGGISAFLSDAIVAFQWAIDKYKNTGKPQILSNSWGMYQRAWAPDYCTDPNHPFTRKVVEAINAGMIVTFAAGNCGQVCASGRCGSDSGPGKSIWGANGHPAVITVGATNIREEWIGYSSQGPAALDAKKPDFVAPSHFKGFTNSDNGTSAANPVCAGVLALLRGHNPALKQAEAKKALQQTAKDLCGNGWDQHSGYGMINAERAFNKLNYFTTTLIHASWTHGHAATVQRPELLDQSSLYAPYSLFKGKPNTTNVFHFAVPTPVIVNNKRLALDSIMLLFWTDVGVEVTAVEIWDANARLKRYDGLSLTGSHWFERFDVLNNRVRYGIGVSVTARFSEEGDRRIIFGSCGGDFTA
ncbi:S8 family peptidase [Halioxenophilus aromaticivorans]|uniref:Peptidase S8/S53 domain-containing protein n=1 Tax=Halioxenophilus aromaticivorans TaxID=1306992 RepID=A0AAV3TXF7_9ALTE